MQYVKLRNCDIGDMSTPLLRQCIRSAATRLSIEDQNALAQSLQELCGESRRYSDRIIREDLIQEAHGYIKNCGDRCGLSDLSEDIERCIEMANSQTEDECRYGLFYMICMAVNDIGWSLANLESQKKVEDIIIKFLERQNCKSDDINSV